MQRAGHHQQRAQIAQHLCPDNGLRGQMVRKGITPRNHMKDNLRELREKQAHNRDALEEAARPQKDLFKLQQFRDVDSKVFQQRRNSFDEQNLSGKEFLPKGVAAKRREDLAKENRNARAEIEAKMAEARHYSNEQPASDRRPSIPKEPAQLAPSSNVNFISRNKVNAIANVPTSKHGEQKHRDASGPGKHKEYGRVPDYLVERKMQREMEEEEMRRRAPDPSCPPGMSLMPESERLSTLETLHASKEEALTQLRKLPFVIETPNMKRKQDYLEQKLREIDSALTIFSKQKVYVAIDR